MSFFEEYTPGNKKYFTGFLFTLVNFECRCFEEWIRNEFWPRSEYENNRIDFHYARNDDQQIIRCQYESSSYKPERELMLMRSKCYMILHTIKRCDDKLFVNSLEKNSIKTRYEYPCIHNKLKKISNYVFSRPAIIFLFCIILLFSINFCYS